jgi:NAD-dependent dihydropyrimidine dehydrogenase PreA subunit
MCEFCLQHGEGKKWYLRAENYAEELLADVSRRKMISDFGRAARSLDGVLDRLDKIDQTPPLVRRLMRWTTTRRMKKQHYGQVVPIEDVERIFEFVTSVVRVACICRSATIGKEHRYCYGLSMGPNGGELFRLFQELAPEYMTGPEMDGLEVMDKKDALAAFRDHEREGLCHTIWTFQTPFIGGLCNCDRTDCLALRCTLGHDLPMCFRAEYVAEVDPERCTGCRACLGQCQFGALAYSPARQRVSVDPRRCFGCGVCRAVCPTEALDLVDRRSVPAAAARW